MGKGRPTPRKSLVAIESRLRELGFETRERQGRIHVPTRHGFTRKQTEEIWRVVDRYGARVRVNKVIVTKPRGRIVWS